MIYILLNAVPIIAATFIGLACAAFVDRPRSVIAWIIALISALWLNTILAGALILAPPRGSVWVMTIGSAVVIWIGFVAPTLATSLAFTGQGWGRIGRSCLWWLVLMLVAAVVMRLVGLVAPPL